ncbi:histidinol dehydrogenase [Proteobacteria bacterium 005FR1]|nr:histidinol dehydrogenase [Proteobacteria bacterium 005FR1]
MADKPIINRINAAEADFDARLDKLLAFEDAAEAAVDESVRQIIADVRKRGDAAVVEYSNRFDRLDVKSFSELVIGRERLHAALETISVEQRHALQTAARRVSDYHRHQLAESWQYTDDDGSVLGQRITPMDRVGLYVPGGKASYPSSVLMNALPAQVAGVGEVVMVSPTPDGVVNEMVLAAAAVAGIDKVLTIGGAQAVAALAYGTETVPAVDKIVGPGNVFVAAAKRQVFGKVAIDMIAGPSEILIICDGKTDPDWIAMDLCSQAEHDENAQSILISPDGDFLQAVSNSLEKLVPTLSRESIARQSLQARGALIQSDSLEQAVEINNRIAPEHLELSVENPEELLPGVRHAGAIFLGRHTAEALGDYCAGPNHVLPTSGTARFSSPLGVYDFQKRSSIIHCSPKAASELGKVASVLARSESLEAHARSAEYRIEK